MDKIGLSNLISYVNIDNKINFKIYEKIMSVLPEFDMKYLINFSIEKIGTDKLNYQKINFIEIIDLFSQQDNLMS